MSDWQGRLITDERGKVRPRMLTNIVLFLENESMVGVIARRDDGVALVKEPPWGGSVPRRLTHNDITEARMYLERKGLTPTRSQVKDAMEFISLKAAEGG